MSGYVARTVWLLHIFTVMPVPHSGFYITSSGKPALMWIWIRDYCWRNHTQCHLRDLVPIPNDDPIHSSPVIPTHHFPSREQVLIFHCLENQSLVSQSCTQHTPILVSSSLSMPGNIHHPLPQPQHHIALPLHGVPLLSSPEPKVLSARPNCFWRKQNKTFLFFRNQWSLWSGSRFTTTKQHLSKFSFRLLFPYTK